MSLRAAAPDTVEDVYDAIVLAGGQARRLAGADKPTLVVGGRTLLDRVVAAVDWPAASCRRPRRPLERTSSGAARSRPAAGPVAAIAAGLPQTSAEVVLVLAADLPYIAGAVAALLAASAAATSRCSPMRTAGPTTSPRPGAGRRWSAALAGSATRRRRRPVAVGRVAAVSVADDGRLGARLRHLGRPRGRPRGGRKA